MSNMKKKRLTAAQLQYNELVDNMEPKRPILKNCVRAFIVGGIRVFISF